MTEYFKGLYTRTMKEAYSKADSSIISALGNGGLCLDCGAGEGRKFKQLADAGAIGLDRYTGLEWNERLVNSARDKGLNVIKADLNKRLPFDEGNFKCVFGLSVLEHILNPCHYMKECYRVLESGGTLVLLTPNISTFFTAVLILMGKMPSSGPHPDSNELKSDEEFIKVSSEVIGQDTEGDTPEHRHLVVFSFRVLRKYLRLLGFKEIEGYGFGLYPFPNCLQPFLEKVDPYHCHQMVFVARK